MLKELTMMLAVPDSVRVYEVVHAALLSAVTRSSTYSAVPCTA